MSFWSSLVGAVPVIGPIAAPLIGLAGGAIASALSPGKPAGSLPTQINQAGNDTLGTAKNYFTSALGGDQSTLEGLLGPQISTVLSQYDNAAKVAANLGPRGGGRTAVLANAPFQKAGAYGQALAGAQSNAAGELTKIGGEQNQEGEAQVNANLEQNKLSQGAYQFGQGQTAAIGKGLGGILTNILAKNKAPGGGSYNPLLIQNTDSIPEFPQGS